MEPGIIGGASWQHTRHGVGDRHAEPQEACDGPVQGRGRFIVGPPGAVKRSVPQGVSLSLPSSLSRNGMHSVPTQRHRSPVECGNPDSYRCDRVILVAEAKPPTSHSELVVLVPRPAGATTVRAAFGGDLSLPWLPRRVMRSACRGRCHPPVHPRLESMLPAHLWTRTPTRSWARSTVRTA